MRAALHPGIQAFAKSRGEDDTGELLAFHLQALADGHVQPRVTAVMMPATADGG
jgi:hypothetical protein